MKQEFARCLFEGSLANENMHYPHLKYDFSKGELELDLKLWLITVTKSPLVKFKPV